MLIHHVGMVVHKGIAFRVKPNAAQREKLARHFSHNRFIWNHFPAVKNMPGNRSPTKSITDAVSQVLGQFPSE